MTIAIPEDKQTCPQYFETIRASLKDILGDLAIRIDHIGSTSVPNPGAKDIIDIQTNVEELTV